MSAREPESGRWYLSVSGDWLTTRTTGPDDESPNQYDYQPHACGLCWLHISHTVARCAQERGRS